MKKSLMVLAVICFMATMAMADELRVMGYYDTERDQQTITLTGWANLPYNFGVWSFVDGFSNRGDMEGVANEADLSGFYTEFNLHYKLMLDNDKKKQLRLITEYNDGSLSDAVLRPGFQYFQITKWGNFAFKVLPYRINLVEQDPVPDPTGQVGVAWRINLLEDKVFFEGFADFNWLYENQKDHYPFIIEPQLGYNLTKHVALVVEYRYTNLLPNQDDQGLGIGAQWTF